jgi:hypothetical protein
MTSPCSVVAVGLVEVAGHDVLLLDGDGFLADASRAVW